MVDYVLIGFRLAATSGIDLKNDREDRESDYDSGGEDAHLADFAGERSSVDFRACSLRAPRAAGALTGDRCRSCRHNGRWFYYGFRFIVFFGFTTACRTFGLYEDVGAAP